MLSEINRVNLLRRNAPLALGAAEEPLKFPPLGLGACDQRVGNDLSYTSDEEGYFLSTMKQNIPLVIKKTKKSMKGLNVLAAFLGGAVVGAACGLLFAPQSGTDTRAKIAEALRKKGIRLSRKELDSLVDDIADDVKQD